MKQIISAAMSAMPAIPAMYSIVARITGFWVGYSFVDEGEGDAVETMLLMSKGTMSG